MAYAEIEILVKYLKRTPEYLNNYSLKDVDWIFKVGEDTPGFKDLVDLAFKKENIYSNLTGTVVENYLDQYNQQYVANTLTLIDGVLIIYVGGAIVYEVATTGGVALTIGAKVIPVVGYTAAQWEQAVNHAVTSVNSNSAHHILQSKHLWSNLVNNPTWDKISVYIYRTLMYGESTSLGSWPGKQLLINGNLVQVKYVIVDGILKISDAFIKSN